MRPERRSPPFGKPFGDGSRQAAPKTASISVALAGHGCFGRDADTGAHETFPRGKPATAFLFKLIAQLQFRGTAPMIDVQAYAEWPAK